MLNELNLTPELLEKAKSATSATELLAFAQENGITITTDEATLYFAQLHPKDGALSDEELDNVSGGCDSCYKENKKIAIDYVIANYCGKVPRCNVYQEADMKKKEFYLSRPRDYLEICYCCHCKAEIDAKCQSMGWPRLNRYYW